MPAARAKRASRIKAGSLGRVAYSVTAPATKPTEAPASTIGYGALSAERMVPHCESLSCKLDVITPITEPRSKTSWFGLALYPVMRPARTDGLPPPMKVALACPQWLDRA